MAILAEVRFAHEDGALVDTLSERPDLQLSVVSDARTDPEQSFYLFRFENADLDDVCPVLEDDHTVCGVERMRGFEDQHLLGVEFAPETMLLNPAVTNRDGFVLEARGEENGTRPRGWHERWLLPDGETLRSIWQDARDAGFEFDVLEVRQQGRDGPAFASDSLTDQQREALEAAYRAGYFAEPRETSLEELAESLDLSPTAVSGRLRRGMKSLIGTTLSGTDAGDGASPFDESPRW